MFSFVIFLPNRLSNFSLFHFIFFLPIFEFFLPRLFFHFFVIFRFNFLLIQIILNFVLSLHREINFSPFSLCNFTTFYHYFLFFSRIIFIVCEFFISSSPKTPFFFVMHSPTFLHINHYFHFLHCIFFFIFSQNFHLLQWEPFTLLHSFFHKPFHPQI